MKTGGQIPQVISRSLSPCAEKGRTVVYLPVSYVSVCVSEPLRVTWVPGNLPGNCLLYDQEGLYMGSKRARKSAQGGIHASSILAIGTLGTSDYNTKVHIHPRAVVGAVGGTYLLLRSRTWPRNAIHLFHLGYRCRSSPSPFQVSIAEEP